MSKPHNRVGKTIIGVLLLFGRLLPEPQINSGKVIAQLLILDNLQHDGVNREHLHAEIKQRLAILEDVLNQDMQIGDVGHGERLLKLISLKQGEHEFVQNFLGFLAHQLR